MFRTVDDFLKTWNRESEVTLEVLAMVSDDAMVQASADGHRNLGQIAWHLPVSLGQLGRKMGLDFETPGLTTTMPMDMAMTVNAYRKASEGLYGAIEESWTDATLEERDDIYGDSWPRGETLMTLLSHEIHHRGQMTVLMRLAGLKLPPVYGPTRDQTG